MKRFVFAAVAATFLVLGASPAQADVAPILPSGDELFEMTCDSGSNDRQLFSLDLVALARDSVGSGTSVSALAEDCGTQGAILPGTDWFYFVDGQSGDLVRADLNTGTIEVIATVLKNGSAVTVYSLAIGPDGSAYMIGVAHKLYSLNLASGALTELGAVNLPTGTTYGFAYDAVTDDFYVAESGHGTLSTLDIATQTATLVGTNAGRFIGSMSFDSDGNLWVNGDFGGAVSQTTLADFGTPANWKNSDGMSPDLYSVSLVVRHGSASSGGGGGGDDEDESLANTGSADATAYLVGGLLSAGIALALRRRRV